MSASVELEDSPDVRQRLDEPVDLLARVVDGQARSRRRGNAQAVHQDLRAVVAGADADRMPVASPIAGVPPSNLAGRSAQVISSRRTVRIIDPPPMNGGISSSSSRRP